MGLFQWYPFVSKLNDKVNFHITYNEEGSKVTPNVYHLAMRYGLEMLCKHLQDLGQQDLKTHVIFEARGKTEDLALEMEFRWKEFSYSIMHQVAPLIGFQQFS